MKILLDENLDHRLRRHLGTHEVYTVDYLGWSGLKNCEFLRTAEEAGFAVFLTGYKNLAYQQNIAARRRSMFVKCVEVAIAGPEVRAGSAQIFPVIHCGQWQIA